VRAGHATRLFHYFILESSGWFSEFREQCLCIRFKKYKAATN
jgi:hypothetical protein